MKNITSKILSVNDARYFAKKWVQKGIFQMFEAGIAPTLQQKWKI